jgi:ABC-type antimicrobial peptide transport system permease subunit
VTTQRRREIAIRIALGVACGLAGAAVLSRLMAGLLFGTSSLDPVTYGLVSLGLVGIAALASYAPARTATRLDPVRSLRGE